MNQLFLSSIHKKCDNPFINVESPMISRKLATNILIEECPPAPPTSPSGTPPPELSLSSNSLSSLSSLSDSSGSPIFSPQPSVEWKPSNGSYVPMGLSSHAMFDPIRYKTEMCKNFEELGHCKFGRNCYYAHFANELKPATYKHKKHKTQLCKPFHENGYCDFGSRCGFIHSKPDINQILFNFQQFLSSAPPMPDIDNKELVDKVVNEVINGRVDTLLRPTTERRLRVFENIVNTNHN